MATNLAKGLRESMDPKLPPLLIYNRTASKAQKLAEELKDMVEVVDSVEEIGKRAQYVFTSLSNDQAAEEVYRKLCKGEEEARGKNKHERGNASHVVFVDTR